MSHNLAEPGMTGAYIRQQENRGDEQGAAHNGAKQPAAYLPVTQLVLFCYDNLGIRSQLRFDCGFGAVTVRGDHNPDDDGGSAD